MNSSLYYCSPRQQLFDTIDRMVRDTPKHESQIRLRTDAIEFRGAKEAVDCGGTFAARICSSEQIIASIMRTST